MLNRPRQLFTKELIAKRLYVVKPFAARINHTYKRCMDIVFSLLFLIPACPIMIIIALLVKLTSPGPIFYTQERLTLHEKRFRILKFRTMTADAEKRTGPTWVRQRDARITPLGKVLRDTHLDELPQLFNILMGDMSLVGPRPERPFFVEQFKAENIPEYSYRHFAKAGLTGYAQLNCPNPELSEIYQKTQDDVWYIKNWSLYLDFCLLFQTFLYFGLCCLKVLNKVYEKSYQHFSSMLKTIYLKKALAQEVCYSEVEVNK